MTRKATVDRVQAVSAQSVPAHDIIRHATPKITYLTRTGQGQSFADALKKLQPINANVSGVLMTLCNTWCDILPDTERAAVLLPILPHMAGSGPAADLDRSRELMIWAMDAACDWMVLIGMREQVSAVQQAKNEPYSHAAAMLADTMRDAVHAWDECRTGSGERIKLYVQDAAKQAVESCGLVAAMTGAQTSDFSVSRSQLIGFLRQITEACAKMAAARASQQAAKADTYDTGSISAGKIDVADARLRAWDAFHKVRLDLQASLAALVMKMTGAKAEA